MGEFGAASYALGAAAYGAASLLLVADRSRRRTTWLLAAVGTSALWAAGLTALLLRGDPPLAAIVALDALHALVWLACVLSWLAPSPDRRMPWTRPGLLAGGAGLALYALAAAAFSAPDSMIARTVTPALFCISLLGLLAVEQVHRNAREGRHSGLRLLCLAAGAVFVMDMFVFSQAALVGSPTPYLWEGRGAANAALVPLILIALNHRSQWDRDLIVSRQVAFYTATFVAVGGYLLLMSAVVLVIRAFGLRWGIALEGVFLALAAAVLALVLYSSTIRAHLKVFLVKHFYRQKYDYRTQWLSLTEALGASADPRLLGESALSGIAQIIGAKDAALWLEGQGTSYERTVCLDREMAAPLFNKEHPIIAFLAEKKWVIDSEEYASEPDKYGNAFGHPADGVLPEGTIIVPLDCQGHLLGFVVLAKPPAVAALNFEDHDILKTAGRQIAVVLAQALAQEQLTATRQFEAMNKLATFLMHDLKNVVAQQELIVANFPRFRHRPEFIDDAMATIRSGAQRIRRVLDQLQAPAHAPSGRRVDVSKVLMEVRSNCADRAPVPEVSSTHGVVLVEMERDKLVSVLTHLIRNAQDATPDDGKIKVEVAKRGANVAITVADTGVGMDASFVRYRLFRPFDTTKGVMGMGIGAYQVRETVRSVGGEVDVHSEVGVGTTFCVTLPAAKEAANEGGRSLQQPAA
jgi:putative PEP-CTERM system histidine kinase